MSTFVDLSPIVKTVQVTLTAEEAFALFTDALDSWWPKETHSIGDDKVTEVLFEARPGGRIYERWNDGSEHEWGRVVEMERPRSISFDWQPNEDRQRPTFIQVSFTEVDGGTEVRLEHSRWEALGDDASRARSTYLPGWDFTLGRYVDAANDR